MAYEIQGADKSSIVEATTNVDWIKNFNYAEPGYVQFDYTALDEGVESRSGQITLSYTGAADVVVTVNQGGTMTFELTIDPKSITANGCAMQIVPSNESETYLCAFMTKEYVDSFESDEAFIQADLEAVKEQAESRGMKLSEWLNILLMKGSKTNTVDDLSLANTAYYGFYPLEGNFCWSGSENASVQCDLQKRDYNMTVSLGGAVPLYQIHQNPYVVHVLVNGNDIGTITLDDQQNDGAYTLSVSKEVLHDGSNIVTFQSKLWKGSCVMEDDERELGIPLQDVEFEAA